MVLRTVAVALCFMLIAAPAARAQETRKPPYWASIASGEAMMRTGPGKEYPATWQYRRADLPVRVLEIYKSWRKIRDPDGTTGWMLVSLLSSTRTALVLGTQQHPLYEKPDTASKTRYFVRPGVVGRLSRCANNWCQLDVKGKRGYISTSAIWGLDPGESF